MKRRQRIQSIHARSLYIHAYNELISLTVVHQDPLAFVRSLARSFSSRAIIDEHSAGGRVVSDGEKGAREREEVKGQHVRLCTTSNCQVVNFSNVEVHAVTVYISIMIIIISDTDSQVLIE